MKKVIVTVVAAGLIATNLAHADINSVTIGKMDHDISAAAFSTIINFTAPDNIKNWEFGFYMPRTFLSQKGGVNPGLTMKICQGESNCADLVYVKAPSITAPDKSAGYTTILSSSTPYALVKGGTYTIKLLHNNQWMPGNYSSFPQHFFIVANHKVYNLASNKSQYKLENYNQSAIDSAITNHISSNWYNSAPVSTASSNILVPTPVSYKVQKGFYSIPQNIAIHNLFSSDNTVANIFIKTLAKNNLGSTATIDHQNADTGIIIEKISPNLINNNPEGYIIKIKPQVIIIGVINDAGIFYALQSLLQLWNANPQQLQAATIIDYPRFKYRGILLDTARHYFTVTQLKHFIDLMAAHKLNTLHIHFSDDEGFRLALPGISDSLKSIGSIRGYGKEIGPMLFLQGNLDITNTSQQKYPDASQLYKGSYSPSQIQELIKYANNRQITIIPEIDLPGHARALIKSLPSSFVDPNDASTFASVQGYTDNVIPVCTYHSSVSVGPQFTQTINNMVNQIASLFSNQTTVYANNKEVNVGADEVSPNAWINDKSCVGIWSQLTALQKSQQFFQFLAENHQNVLFSGWQQLVQGDDTTLGNAIIPASQVGHIYVWNVSSGNNGGIQQAISLAENGYPTVLAFADQTYFDLAYTPDINEPGFSWATKFSDTYAALSSALSATQTLNGIPASQQGNILGIEGALWSENLPTYNHLIYMALPKMAGLAEASWSPASITVNANQQLNWKSLATRLGFGKTGFLAYLNKVYHVRYRGYPNGIQKEVPGVKN